MLCSTFVLTNIYCRTWVFDIRVPFWLGARVAACFRVWLLAQQGRMMARSGFWDGAEDWEDQEVHRVAELRQEGENMNGTRQWDEEEECPAGPWM